MRTLVLVLLAIAGFASPSLAQPGYGTELSDVVGHWAGSVTEPVDGRTLHYNMTLDIAADADGNPVGTVEYDLGCKGVWVGGEGVHEVWMFEETITAGLDQCEPRVFVELVSRNGALSVRLIPVPDVHPDGVRAFYENAAEATLHRR